MRSVAATAFAAFTIHAAVANPIVYDPTVATSLSAELVNITVRKASSDISGKFTFRQSEEVRADDSTASIVIEVPFFAPWPQGMLSLTSSARASVKIGGQFFHPSSVSVGPEIRGLTEGWRMYLLEVEIPRRIVQREFSVRIQYRQRHLPGNISPYYPVHPPAATNSKSLVQFIAGDRVTLNLVSNARRVVQKLSNLIAVVPEDKSLILVTAQSR
jgi:hypothetical protein